MRCSEARGRLIESHGDVSANASDSDLRQHLRVCSDCSAFARAELELQRDIAIAASDDFTDDLSLPQLRGKVEATVAEISTMERIMSQIKHQVTSRPSLATGIALAAAALIIFTLIPFSFSKVVGYKVSIAGLEPESNISPKLLSEVIAAIGYQDVTVTSRREGDSEKYTIENIPTEGEAHVLAHVVASVNGYEMASFVESDSDVVRRIAIEEAVEKAGVQQVTLKPRYVKIDVEPIVQSKSDPLYVRIATHATTKSSTASTAVSTARIRPIDLQFDDNGIFINGENLEGRLLSPDIADADIEAMVKAFFLRHGVADSNISVMSRTDLLNETRMIRINLDESFGLKMDGGILEVDVDEKSIYLKNPDGKKKLASEKLYEIAVPDSSFRGETILMNLRLKSTD